MVLWVVPVTALLAVQMAGGVGDAAVVRGRGGGMGEPYLGGRAAGRTGSEGDLGDASVDGAACDSVPEGGVGDVLGVGVGDAGSVVGDAPVVSACSFCEGAAGRVMAGVALVMTTVWVQWVMVLGVSSCMGGRGRGPLPLPAERLVGICGWLVCRPQWCWPPLVSSHALANHGGGC